MSDEAPAAVVKKRRGRPAKKRHDPEGAGTGTHTDETVLNQDPGMDYMWVSEDDEARLLNRGAVVCKRDSEQARPVSDKRRDTGEANFKFKGLTLMKIAKELNARAQAQGLSIARQRSEAMRRQATGQVGNGQFASISQHEYGRQAI